MPTYNREALTIGKADIYVAPAMTAPPTLVTAQPGVEWISGGYTDESVTATVAQEHAIKRVQQSTMDVKRSRTSLAVTLATVLSETSLDKLKLALAGLAQIVEQSAGVDTPGSSTLTVQTGSQVEEYALLIDGDTSAPGGRRRRIYVPVCVVSSDLDLSIDKDEYAALPVEFSALDPGDVPPFTVVDHTAAALDA